MLVTDGNQGLTCKRSYVCSQIARIRQAVGPFRLPPWRQRMVARTLEVCHPKGPKWLGVWRCPNGFIFRCGKSVGFLTDERYQKTAVMFVDQNWSMKLWEWPQNRVEQETLSWWFKNWGVVVTSKTAEDLDWIRDKMGQMDTHWDTPWRPLLSLHCHRKSCFKNYLLDRTAKFVSTRESTKRPNATLGRSHFVLFFG